jgi:formylmethanofuran dehydrogenase subunit E
MRRATVGIHVTGTEIFTGLVEVRFIPIIQEKLEYYGCRVVKSVIVRDDRKAICDSVKDLLACDVDLLVTTAGLSFDSDDVTRQGLMGCRGCCCAIRGTDPTGEYDLAGPYRSGAGCWCARVRALP